MVTNGGGGHGRRAEIGVRTNVRSQFAADHLRGFGGGGRRKDSIPRTRRGGNGTDAERRDGATEGDGARHLNKNKRREERSGRGRRRQRTRATHSTDKTKKTEKSARE